MVFIFFLKISRDAYVFITSNILFYNNTPWYLKLFTPLPYRNCLGCRCWDCMMTSSNGDIFRVTGHLYGEFIGHRWIPTQRPVMRSFGVFFDLRLNERLSKQSWGWWFETLSRPLWHRCNAVSEPIFEYTWEFVVSIFIYKYTYW